MSNFTFSHCLSNKTISVYWAKSKNTVVLQLNDADWNIGLYNYKLFDFYSIIEQVALELITNYTPGGKLAKAPEFIQKKCLKIRIGKLIAKELARLMKILLTLVNPDYIAFDKMLFCCVGSKPPLNAKSLIGESCWQDKQFIKDITTYRIAMMAFLAKYWFDRPVGIKYEAFDWLHYIRPKATKQERVALLSIKYPIRRDLITKFKNKYVKIKSTRFEMIVQLLYSYDTKHESRPFNDVVLQTTYNEWQKIVKLLHNNVFQCKFTKQYNFTHNINKLETFYTNQNTLFEVAQQAFQAWIKNNEWYTKQKELLPPIPSKLARDKDITSFKTIKEMNKYSKINTNIDGSNQFFGYKNNLYNIFNNKTIVCIQQKTKIRGQNFLKKKWLRLIKESAE